MSKARILIVDDEPAIRFFLKDALQEDGYEVMAVASGYEALSVIESGFFNLVLLDLRLNDMNGRDIVVALQGQSPDIAIIILTANPFLDPHDELLRTQCKYIHKPIKINRLLKEIDQTLLEQRKNRNS